MTLQGRVFYACSLLAALGLLATACADHSGGCRWDIDCPGIAVCLEGVCVALPDDEPDGAADADAGPGGATDGADAVAGDPGDAGAVDDGADSDQTDGGGDLDDGDAGTDEPAHPPRMDFGYYRVDRVPSGGSDSSAEVRAWTNLVYVDWSADARAFDYPVGSDMSALRANMDGILQRVTDAGHKVMMDVAFDTAWGPRLTKADILATARPYWDSIAYLMLGDELELSLDDAESLLDEFRRAVVNVGLEPRPFGVTLTPAYVLSNPPVLQASWDYIAIEAYTPTCSCASCGSGDADQEVQEVVAQLAQQEALIPAGTKLVLILQGYDRNGAFADHAGLAEINRASYFQIARDDPRYLAMTIFAWEREGSTCAQNPYPEYGHGSSGLPGVQAVHQEIWRDLTRP